MSSHARRTRCLWKTLFAALNEERIPFVTVGGGTNILVKDGGIYGSGYFIKEFQAQ